MRSGRARGTTTAATMALLLAAAATTGTHAALLPATAAGAGRRLLASSRRGYTYGFLAPVGLLASAAPAAVVVRAAAAAPNAGGSNGPRTADLVSRRGGANAAGGSSGGVLGSITRLFSGRGGDTIRTEAPAVGALEAAGPGAGEGWKGDLLVLPVFQAEDGDGVVEVGGQPILAAWDAALGGAVAELVQTVRALPWAVGRVRWLGRELGMCVCMYVHIRRVIIHSQISLKSPPIAEGVQGQGRERGARAAGRTGGQGPDPGGPRQEERLQERARRKFRMIHGRDGHVSCGGVDREERPE